MLCKEKRKGMESALCKARMKQDGEKRDGHCTLYKTERKVDGMGVTKLNRVT